MSRRYIVIDLDGLAYGRAEASDRVRLFALYGLHPHANAAGHAAATVFSSLAAARQAVSAECEARERLLSRREADEWYAKVRLVPLTDGAA
jgi:hypothetical protein